ncbi:hypothetical protein SAMD00019534_043420 [Acytostelium subglobosum LB1]|uniref:hypothetical protein n=1 Tax=Acytostelium subglobosum LB1 TaxID=1410327 RepID=UPI000644AF29|nr:hypothetical protein SAMD00019534_043420 [Acytostelium subglobosum LB1]GAM21167.1 hypothetical protein SAMD00019534_043420 [Acytostelium subglobosum LB1]|eukprot:XP_012756301.1 hypothetical protein SAMD00019534_043420 [Acytostelium subglobosum LB1]
MNVSQWYNNLAGNPLIWKELCFKPNVHSGMSLPRELLGVGTHSLPSTIDWRLIYRELSTLQTEDVIRGVVSSSSCDRSSQRIDNTLFDNPDFWSSTGSSTTDANESLVYVLGQPYAMSSTFKIKVYKSWHQYEHPCYPPQRIKISIGHFPSVDYHYVSKEFDVVSGTDDEQIFDLGQLVYGRYLRVDLIGKVQAQLSDNLLYTAIERVKMDGVSIGRSQCPNLFELLSNFQVKLTKYVK